MTALKVAAAAAVALALLVVIAWRIPTTVQVSRVFAATPERVWALWADESTVAKWWGPKGYTSPAVRHDFRAGGAFALAMRSPAGKVFWNAGSYVELLPQQRIVQTMAFADDQGRPMPGADAPVPGRWPDYVTITTEFHAAAGGTEVRILESGVPLLMKLFAGMGWQQQFDKMEALLGKT
jgi:uncharacterized protein YndB with AHSA1/START domain